MVPRLRKLLADCSGLELRLATGTDYTKFLADEFDADVVYGAPSTDYYGALKQQGVIVLPLGTEVVTPLCAPSLAPVIRSPSDLLKQTLIESDNKKVRWPAWFAANGLVAPLPNGPRAYGRRGKIDAQDRYWFAEYSADKIAMLGDTAAKLLGI